MSQFSDTADATLAYVEEVTFDTPPTTGYTLLRFTGESLNTSLESAKSDEIEADRQYTGSVHVSGASAGDVNYQLSYGEYDTFLSAALGASGWSTPYSDTITDVTSQVCTVTSTTGLQVGQGVKITGLTVAAEDGIYTVSAVLSGTTFEVVETITNEATATATVNHSGAITNGTADRSFAFEKKFAAGGSNHYFLMSGMRVNGFNMSLSSGSILNGSISLMGATGLGSATSQEVGTYAAAGTNELINAVSNIDGLVLSSVDALGDLTAISAVFQEFSWSVNNNMRNQPAVGYLYPADIGSGRIMVEATATIYFANRDLFDEFVVNGNVNLRWQIADDKDAYGNRYVFMIPKAKVASHEVVAGGPDSDILANVTFSAEKDTLMGSNKTIVVSRIAAV